MDFFHMPPASVSGYAPPPARRVGSYFPITAFPDHQPSALSRNAGINSHCAGPPFFSLCRYFALCRETSGL